MTHRLRHTVLAAAIATVMAGATSCNSKSNEGGVPAETLYDIVTLSPSSASGSVFTFRRWGDSPLITLVSPLTIDKDVVKPGERLMIAYTPAEGNKPYESGAIDLYAYLTVLNGKVGMATDAETSSWTTDALNIYSLWPSGEYINIHAGLRISQPPVRFELVADRATLSNPMPDIYLIYRPGDGNDGNLSNYYASIDISEVLDLPGCEGVTVHAANTYGSQKREWTFRRGETRAPAE